MENATRQKLVETAGKYAQMPFHGYLDGKNSNLDPIVRHFPKWTLKEADRLWCAAFVYYCCIEAGFAIPCRPRECVTCNLAGCLAWEEFAKGDSRIEYHKGNEDFCPGAGDIVLFDRVFINQEHDHIGIVLEAGENGLVTAEGNVGNDNISRVLSRPADEHIRAYIRIPDGYRYEAGGTA